MFPLVSIGFALGISPDLYIVGGTVAEPTGLLIPGESSDNPTLHKVTTSAVSV
jgi:hypothetical protein